MAYIIFNTEQEAEDRSEQAGIAKGLSYHKTASGSRYWWGWVVEAAEENPRAAIVIRKDTFVDPETEEETTTIQEKQLLTDEQIENLVDELPEDWVQPVDPDDDESPTEDEEEEVPEEPVDGND